MLTHDGGDVEIIDIKESLVFCRLQGTAPVAATRAKP